MADVMGLQGAYGIDSLQQNVRQQIADRIAEQERQRKAAMDQQEMQLRIQEAQQRAEMQRAQLSSLQEVRDQQNQDRQRVNAQALLGAHLPGDVLSPQTVSAVGQGGLGDLIGSQAPGLASRDILNRPTLTMRGQFVSSAPAVTSPESYSMGLPAQREEQAKVARTKAIMADPNTSNALRQFLSVVPDPSKADYHLFTEPNGPPGTTTDANYMLNGKPIVAVRQKGRLTYQGQDVTDQVQPYVAPRDTSARDATREQTSYTYHRSALDKIGKPVEDQQARLSRLVDTLNQATPQSDSVVAPEFLAVMAGGIGSGVRQNEAELARIVGGRSKWQTLQTTLNQWKTDPAKANSITPEQRQQMRALVSAVADKNSQVLSVLDDAGEALVHADPFQHREILNAAKKKIRTVYGAPASTTQSQGPDLYQEYLNRTKKPGG